MGYLFRNNLIFTGFKVPKLSGITSYQLTSKDPIFQGNLITTYSKDQFLEGKGLVVPKLFLPRTWWTSWICLFHESKAVPFARGSDVEYYLGGEKHSKHSPHGCLEAETAAYRQKPTSARAPIGILTLSCTETKCCHTTRHKTLISLSKIKLCKVSSEHKTQKLKICRSTWSNIFISRSHGTALICIDESQNLCYSTMMEPQEANVLIEMWAIVMCNFWDLLILRRRGSSQGDGHFCKKGKVLKHFFPFSSILVKDTCQSMVIECHHLVSSSEKTLKITSRLQFLYQKEEIHILRFTHSNKLSWDQVFCASTC